MAQRFGGALNLNVHIYALALDGVFARDAAGVVVFHPARRITTLDVAPPPIDQAADPRLHRSQDAAMPRTEPSGPWRV